MVYCEQVEAGFNLHCELLAVAVETIPVSPDKRASYTVSALGAYTIRVRDGLYHTNRPFSLR